ncbi:hypothetical protein FZW96_09995 [Bacillus sp. BGMRC 2118]|nr:hypothetical protein FZW96_09995 [Bacillus sp. BGMRC 2118]
MRYIFTLTCLALVTACSGPDDPKAPEAQTTNTAAIEVMKTEKTSQRINDQDVTVRHNVKNKDIYVEVVVNGFTFSSKDSKQPKLNEGYLKVYLNGRQVDEIHQAAFILKGLPSGKHQLKLELVQNDGSSYDIQKEMEVVIP